MDEISEQKENLIRQLESLADQTDTGAKKRRNEVWRQLIPLFKKGDEREMAQFLSTELQVQAVTIKRWFAGDFNPRHTHLLRMRALLGLIQRQQHSVQTALGEAPDAAVPFNNAFAAIRTLNHFFYCLRLSKVSFFFKGQLGYHAGRPGGTRETVVSLLEERSKRSNPLTMYYFFTRSSPAEETLARFLKSPRVQSSGVCENIRPFAINGKSADVLTYREDELGLACSPVSPLILIYNEQGRKAFDRFVDVFFEVPVEFVQQDNRPIQHEYSLETAFVQQPEPEALKFWIEVVDYLRRLKANDNKRFANLEDDHLFVPNLSLDTLE